MSGMCASIVRCLVVGLGKTIGEIMKRLCQTVANGSVQAILINFLNGSDSLLWRIFCRAIAWTEVQILSSRYIKILMENN